MLRKNKVIREVQAGYVMCPAQRLEMPVGWCEKTQYHERCKGCDHDKNRDFSIFQMEKRKNV